MGEPLSSYIEEPTRPTAVVSTMNSQSVSYVAAPKRPPPALTTLTLRLKATVRPHGSFETPYCRLAHEACLIVGLPKPVLYRLVTPPVSFYGNFWTCAKPLRTAMFEKGTRGFLSRER